MNPIHSRAKAGLGRVLVIALMSLLAGCDVTDLFPGTSTLNRATVMPTVRPSFTPRPTNTAWPTFTPMPTSAPVTITPGVISGVISTTVNLRAGPGTNYPSPSKLSKGTKINVRGRDLESEWLLLVPPPNGWVKASFVSLSRDMQNLPIVESPPTPVPTPTTAPSLTPMPTATPPMYVDFRADAPYLPAGVCTTIRWDVEGVRGVYLDGSGQPGHGSADVCPKETHTYVLHVVLNSGYLDRAITIIVLSVATATPKT